MPIYGERGGRIFRVCSQSARWPTKTYFRLTHARDSIDARGVGGVRLLNINRSAPEAHTWGYYQIKLLKIAAVWRWRQTWHRFIAERCVLLKETPAGDTSSHKKWIREQVYERLVYFWDIHCLGGKKIMPTTIFYLGSELVRKIKHLIHRSSLKNSKVICDLTESK